MPAVFVAAGFIVAGCLVPASRSRLSSMPAVSKAGCLRGCRLSVAGFLRRRLSSRPAVFVAAGFLRRRLSSRPAVFVAAGFLRRRLSVAGISSPPPASSLPAVFAAGSLRRRRLLSAGCLVPASSRPAVRCRHIFAAAGFIVAGCLRGRQSS